MSQLCWGANCSQKNTQPVTDRRMTINDRGRMNISAPLPLGWDNSEAHVLNSFPEFPSEIQLQLPTVVTLLTPHIESRNPVQDRSKWNPQMMARRDPRMTAVHQMG